jgi:putative ABC transport system permease protein
VGFAFPTTSVTRLEQAAVSSGGGQVDVLAIHPQTFEAAAVWDRTFGSESLATYMNRMKEGVRDGRAPILVVGATPSSETSIRLPGEGSQVLQVRVVGTPRAFPGMRAGTPLLVVDQRAVASKTVGLDQIWAKGSPAEILPAVNASGLPVVRTVSAEDVASSTDFLPISWTFGFLQALGILSGLIALGGALLHLEARQRAREVSYALARRMGLRRGAHRASVAVARSTILLASVVIGATLAGIAARLVFGRLDPLPAIPPPPLFRLPMMLLAATVAVALVASWIGAWRVQRAADRAKVAEVMRLAT